MNILQKKSSENIAEYLILMFQIEDIIRILKFDKSSISDFLVGKDTNSIKSTDFSFYEKIINQMKSEGLEKKGHLSELNEIIVELIYLHNTLLTIMESADYKKIASECANDIAEFRLKTDLSDSHDIEVLLHAMYMKLQLNIRNHEITKETSEAMDRMRLQLAYLSEEYKKMKSGNWNFIKN